MSASLTLKEFLILGLMMRKDLSVASALRQTAFCHGNIEVVSCRADGSIHRYTYADAWRRSQQLAHVLTRPGLSLGDRVGTLAWNGYRHFELYYAAPGSLSIKSPPLSATRAIARDLR
ncbi:hypothetical protein BH09PSE3_BH09PSE3_26670 [soil metagenome]